MRPYRQIAKNGSVMMNLAAGKSQSTGDVITSSFLQDKMTLKINGNTITAPNKVNRYFLSSVIEMLDRMGYSRQAANNYSLNPFIISKFSLLSSEYDETMSKIYNSLSDISMSNFSLLNMDLYRTVLKASGTIQKSGIIKSAGFNVSTSLPTTIIPNLDIAYRKINYPIAPTVTTSSKWVWYAPKSCFYSVLSGTGFIYKLPFNQETGTFGAQETIASDWPFVQSSNNQIQMSDGISKIIHQGQSSNNRYLYIFDMETELVTKVYLTTPIAGSDFFFWDVVNKNIVAYHLVSTNPLIRGCRISLDGTVTVNTGIRGDFAGKAIESGENYRLTDNGYYTMDTTFDPKVSNCSPLTPLGNYKSLWISGNNDGQMMNASLRNGIWIIEMSAKPDTASTLVELPDIVVNSGDTFTVEYEFKMLDTRK